MENGMQSCHGMPEIKAKDLVEPFWFEKWFLKIKSNINNAI